MSDSLAERKLQKKFRNWAEKKGWWVRKFKAVGNNGVPDLVLAKKVRVRKSKFYTEVKTPEGELSPIQIEEIREMREQGLVVYVVDDFEDFKFILANEEP